jgi:hypothetical protein
MDTIVMLRQRGNRSYLQEMLLADIKVDLRHGKASFQVVV